MENEKINTEKTPETLNQLEARLNAEVADFFETDKLKPDITIFKSKADLDRQKIEMSNGKITEAPDWLVAFVTGKDSINILSPDVMPPDMEGDGHTRFPKTLKHEIAHL